MPKMQSKMSTAERIRKVFVGAAMVAAACGGTVLTAPAASAHDASVPVNHCGVFPQLASQCGYGGITDNHTRAYSCDTYSDGIGVRTEFTLRNGTPGHVDDANGSDKGCSAVISGSSANPIVSFRVCQKSNVWFCTRWSPA